MRYFGPPKIFQKSRGRICTRDIKSTVKDVISGTDDSNHILTRILRKTVDNSINTRFRILWGIILGLSTVLCFLLVYDRLAYYFSQPTFVNVENAPLKKEDMPILLLATTSSEEFVQYRREINDTSLLGEHTNAECMSPIDTVLEISGSKATKIWNVLNITSLIDDMFYTENPKIKLPKNFSYYNASVGTATVLKISDFENFGTIYSQLSFKFASSKRFGGRCPHPKVGLSYLFNDKYMPGDVFPATFSMQLTVLIQKDVRLNKTSRPCVDKYEHSHCENKCFQKAIQHFHPHCRLPIMGREFDLPDCEGSLDAVKLHKFILGALAGQYGNYTPPPCLCTQPCEKYKITNDLYFGDQSGNIANIKLQNTIKISTEKLAYDEISLLCDLGGNIGLCLGISCLMIMETVTVGIKFFRQKSKKKILYPKLHKRVTRYATKVMRETEHNIADSFFFPGVEYIVSKDKDKKKMLIWSTIIIICVLICGWQIYDRICTYLTYPVSISMEMEEVEMIQLPKSVVCMVNKKLQFAQKGYIRKNNLTVCPDDIDILEFMGEMSLEKIWKKFKIDDEFQDLSPHMESVNSGSLSPLITEPYATVFGNCARLSTGVFKYSPSYWGYMAMVSAMVDKPSMCGNTAIKLFQQFPGEELSLKNYFEIFTPEMVLIRYTMHKTERINVRQRPCSSTEDGRACEQSCYSKLFKEKLSCSLPTFNNLSLPSCEDKESARRSREMYLSIALHTDPIRDCGCLKRCNESFYYPHMKPEWDLHSITTQFMITIAHNFQEIIREKFSFSFVKLLCDIGSNLGIVVGLSVLSFLADFSQFLNHYQVSRSFK